VEAEVEEVGGLHNRGLLVGLEVVAVDRVALVAPALHHKEIQEATAVLPEAMTAPVLVEAEVVQVEQGLLLVLVMPVTVDLGLTAILQERQLLILVVAVVDLTVVPPAQVDQVAVATEQIQVVQQVQELLIEAEVVVVLGIAESLDLLGQQVDLELL